MKKTHWQRFVAALRSIKWWFQGKLLNRQLKSPETTSRTDAEEAVCRVVMETDIAQDCVQATILRGGPCILIKTDEDWEAFIHKSYKEAADEAIEWLILQGDEVKTAHTSNMNRAERRAFDARRKQKRGGRKTGQRKH